MARGARNIEVEPYTIVVPTAHIRVDGLEVTVARALDIVLVEKPARSTPDVASEGLLERNSKTY